MDAEALEDVFMVHRTDRVYTQRDGKWVWAMGCTCEWVSEFFLMEEQSFDSTCQNDLTMRRIAAQHLAEKVKELR